MEESPRHQLHAEIEQLKERNRLLLIKSREERQKLEERLKSLEYSFESASRRLAEKQEQLDELESLAEQAQSSQPLATKDLPEAAELLNQLKAKLKKKSQANLADVKALLEMIGGDDGVS